MSIANMKSVIIDGMETLVSLLQSNASLIGVVSSNIYRTYNPESDKDNLTAPPVDANGDSMGVAGTPVIVVYVRDADTDEMEDMTTVHKKIGVSVALMARVPTEEVSVIDPITEKFEKLQNVLAITNLIQTSDSQGFQITDLQTSDIVNLEFLQESKVVLCRLDFNLETTVEANFESYTVPVEDSENESQPE